MLPVDGRVTAVIRGGELLFEWGRVKGEISFTPCNLLFKSLSI